VSGRGLDCPPPNVLAMFVEGNLPPDRIAEVIAHLARCAECRLTVEHVSELESQESESETSDAEPVHRNAFRVVAAAAAIGAILLALSFLQQRLVIQKWRSEVRTFAAVLPAEQRLVEPRLTGGFRWAPFYGPARQGNVPRSAAELVSVAAAAELLRRIAHHSSNPALHAKGIALVISGDAGEAIQILEPVAARQTDNALIWSDLSAAIYVDAQRRRSNPFALRRSIEAAEMAIAAEPELAEAYFNRALALERLGDRTRAIAAWKEYLRRDRRSRWAAEAERRLLALERSDGRP
jgi:tetratricopeptide (TPR) repeat protein